MDIRAIMTRHLLASDSEDDRDTKTRPKRKKKVRKRARHRSGSISSSCSCSSCSYSGNSNCSCSCCCTSCSSLSCSSDSDQRFAKYYELSSDEAELRGVDFPAESRKDRRNMVKLLLHTMVMWDDIWKTATPDEPSNAGESDSSSTSETSDTSDPSDDERRAAKFPREANYKRRIMAEGRGSELKRKKDIEEQEDMAERGRLKQAMEMTEDCGVFFSGKWYGQPLEEVDPFIYDDTFCVLGWRQQNTCIVYRYFKGNSVGYFAPDHPVRLFSFAVLTHRYFGLIIILTILANCITLALERFDYDQYGVRFRNLTIVIILESLELVYLLIYTFEMFIKIIAKGLICQRLAYLRNGWNVLNFVVVLSSYLSYLSEAIVSNEFEVGKLEFLRIFRVLRAFKTISILPGLRKIVNALINSAVQLCEVMGLTLFVIMIFALVGMEFFQGKFRNKCVRIQGETNDQGRTPQFRKITPGLSYYMTDWIYNMWVENEHNWLYRDYPDSEALPCGNSSTARHCEEGFVCLEVRNSLSPNEGWISFDTFLLAALQTLQVMTLDYWERTYEIALSTVGKEAIVYFALVIFIGGYYMLNLMLAVVTLCYEKEQNTTDVKTAKLTVQKRLELTRQMSNFHFEHLNQQRLRLFEGFRKRSPRERDELLLRMLRAEEFAHPVMRDRFENSSQCVNAMYKILQQSGRYRKPLPEDGCYEEFHLYESHADAKLVDENGLKLTNGHFCNFNVEGFDQAFIVQNKAKFITRPIPEKDFSLYPEKQKWESMKHWCCVWRRVLQPVVEDWKWRNVMTFCIFVNTCICCLEHHRQPQWLDITIHFSNELFTTIFFLELILKIVAYQHHFFEYGWNKFDLFVVAGSVVDTRLQIGWGFKGLRALKLLRILKLAQAWDTMKILLNILIGAMGEMANLFLILFIAVYIFAVLGMQFLAGGYEPRKFRADFFPANYPRLAWQNSFSAFIMVFRVFCGEWIVLTWECIEAHRVDKEEYKCFLMFMPTLVIGNFIIINLFVALLLHIFDSADEMKKSLKENRKGRGGGLRKLWKRIKRRFSRVEVKKKVEKKRTSFKAMMKRKNKVVPMMKNNDPQNLDALNPEEQENEVQSIITEIETPETQTELNSWGSWFTTTPRTITPVSTAPNINLEAEDLPPEELPPEDLPPQDLPPEELPPEDLPPQDLPQEDLPPQDLPPEDLPSEELPPENLPPSNVEPPRHRPLRIVLPYRIPKWRFYKVVIKYMEFEDGKFDHDSDVDDEDLMPMPNREIDQNQATANDEFQEKRDEACVGKNQRFREIAYRIVLMIRKQHGEQIMAEFERAKVQEMREACLAGKANKDNVCEVVDEGVKVKVEEEEQLNPCFPASWYTNPRCFVCLLEKTRNHPALEYQRRKVLNFVSHSYYEWFMVVLILVSSILLCFDDIHLQEKKGLKVFLFYFGAIITLIFLTDFCLKVFAKGFHYCFTDGWMLLDFIVVVVGVFSFVTDMVLGLDAVSKNNYFASIKVIRTLRALRPLRAISRYEGMKVVVNSLIQAIPAIFNVFCVCIVFWLVFAIMGVQFFKGRFFRCVNELGEVLDHTVAPNKLVCCYKAKSFKFAWVNAFPNFDTVPRAYIALLYLATFQGWNEVIRTATDARDVDVQPVRGNDMLAEAYFISFALFGGFLTTNLFVGVIIDNFNSLKKKFEGDLYEALMSPSQFQYYLAIKRLGRKQPRIVLSKPTSPARLAFFEIAVSPRSEFLMFIVIFFNMAVMCLDKYGNSALDDALLEGLNAFFIYVYTLEAIVKMVGLGKNYLRDGWNVFDLVILFVCMVDYSVSDLLSGTFPVPPSMVRLLRIMRVGRMLRLMKAAKSIRRIVFSVLVSLPSLFNVGALMLLIIFIYSVIGMSVFGRIGYGGPIDEITNFETFLNAFFLLFRLTTLAGWDDILGSLVSAQTECGAPLESDCGEPGKPECVSYIVGLIYIVSFIIITNYVIVNMFIAIILENFDQATKEDELDVTADDIDIFLTKWAVFDGEGTQFMELKYLSPFLNSLESPLRMKFPNQTAMTALDIPIYQKGLVHAYDVLRNVLVFVLGRAEAKQMEDIQSIINVRFAGQFRHKKVLPLVSTTRIWKIQNNSATMLQRFWRKKVKRREAAAAAAAAAETDKKKPKGVVKKGSANINKVNINRAKFQTDHDEEAMIE